MVSPMVTSEHQDSVGLLGPVGQLIHTAAMTPFGQFGVGDAAGIHAGAAHADLASPPGHRAEHQFEVVVTRRYLLARLGARRRVPDEEHPDLLGLPLGERPGQTQTVVAALRSVGPVVEDDQCPSRRLLGHRPAPVATFKPAPRHSAIPSSSRLARNPWSESRSTASRAKTQYGPRQYATTSRSFGS